MVAAIISTRNNQTQFHRPIQKSIDDVNIQTEPPQFSAIMGQPVAHLPLLATIIIGNRTVLLTGKKLMLFKPRNYP